jgi:Ca2+-binding EF-hand superfamily protein
MGNAQVKRYIGGKKPLKYFDEDVWPVVKHTFQKLGLDQGKGFELFVAFSRVDEDQSGKVSVHECMAYFGGHASKYCERVFDVLDIGERDGLEFPEFVCALWNFCTMYTVLLARHMFEIFDPDGCGRLARPDVEALFRMLYDSDDHEPKLTEAFPYGEDGYVSRDDFVAHIHSNRRFVKPAASYQSRVRKALGGFLMW